MPEQRPTKTDKDVPESTAELGRALGASALSKLGATIAALAVNAVLARGLSQSEFAYYGVLIAFSAVFAVFLQFGYQTSITKAAGTASHSGDMRPLAAGIWSGTVITLVLGAASYFALLAVRSWLFPPVDGDAASPWVIALTAAYCTSLALCILYGEAIRGLGRVGLAASLTGMGQHGGVVRTVLLLLVLLPFALVQTLALPTALMIAVSASIVTLLVALVILGRSGALASNPAAAAREFFANLGTNIQMMLGQLLQLGASQHATLIVGGAILSGPPLALLVAAQQIRNLFTAPMTLFNGASPKLLIHAWRDNNLRELEQLVRLGSSVSSMLVVLAAPVFLSLGSWIFGFVFGEDFSEASWYFALLLPGLLAFAMGGSAGRVMILLGREKAFLVYSAIAAAIAIPTLAWSAQNYGATGISIATSAILAAQNLALILLVRKFFGIWSHAYLAPSRYIGITRTVIGMVRRKLSRG